MPDRDSQLFPHTGRRDDRGAALFRAETSLNVCGNVSISRDTASPPESTSTSFGVDQRGQGGRRHDRGPTSRKRFRVGGSGYIGRAHRQTPAHSAWPADRTSATRATHNAGGLPTTARRLSLSASRRYPPRQRCACPMAWGTSGPAGAGGRAITRGFCEGRGNGAIGRL